MGERKEKEREGKEGRGGGLEVIKERRRGGEEERWDRGFRLFVIINEIR